ncbi:MAG TPA: PH domain-containing protein [Microbacteriaceae bacterium]|nr:PH domain-containing protein [Microbacteriaceae bacterium]
MTPSERDPEAVVADLRPSVAALILPTILLIAAVSALAYFGPRLAEPWQQWAVAGGAALVVAFGFVVPLWFWASRRYTVTTRRTILRDGMIVRRRREILHARVIEVAMRRGPGQAVAGSGDVVLELGGRHSAVLHSVRTPALVQAAISDLVEEQRADREYRRANSGEQPQL